MELGIVLVASDFHPSGVRLSNGDRMGGNEVLDLFKKIKGMDWLFFWHSTCYLYSEVLSVLALRQKC